MSAAGFSSAAAVTWGGSDFAGGLGARKAPAQLIVASGHLVSFVLLLAVCLGLRLPFPHQTGVWFAVLGGFEGSLALAVFYRALAMGAMGLTAAFTGLLTALVPVLFSMLREGMPGASVLGGIGLGLAAIWLITRQPGEHGQKTPPLALLLGAMAGCGFGAQLILFKLAGSCGLLWTMTSARAAGSVAMLLVIAVAPPKAAWKGFWQMGILAGLLDTTGNLFYICATQRGRLDVAAMISSLYPAVTILLAGALLHERPSKRQLAGMALALAAVLLLSR